MRRLKILILNILSIPYRILFTHISVFAGIQDSVVERRAAICKGVRFYRSCIGKYSYVGNNTFITNTHIGNFTSISGECYIGGTSHPIHWVSTSSVFHKWKNILHKNFSDFEYDIFQETQIGNDVWIGQGAKIKAGVKIHDGAVIGMGSVVTKNVGPYEVWGGNPAKCIKKRFDEDTIERLLAKEWWNWDDSTIQSKACYMNDIHIFFGEDE
ncbi:MAG: CatB-related O-acetyltransferase [[Ruminococcus] gnavus]|nr:CatB-related O-acetyltransferase [Mediterraneibacter gnavus]